ncbi:diguanylate cyclase [Limimonas halophila]|uniref:diguanylate cyclase n=1 Tax=Limimonas halophila TaxID=1082479 RepID=A0A1G7TII2_9PROT|nr:GGDEF domain-containing protein [Limimonas halophila]SDG35136.1 diguanylate cyclase [Limimonas halophila]
MSSERCDSGTHAIAETALARMKALGIPATPENYQVWYAYCAGTHPDLSRALDVLVSNRDTFTEERNAEIHARFFGGGGDQLSQVADTSHRLEQAISRILSALDEGGRESDATGRRIASLSGHLTGDSSLSVIQETVREIVRETRALLHRNQELEQRLHQSSREVESLRKDLEDTRRDAVTDGLTGIANRKLFDERLRDSMAAAMEHGTRLTIALADIDHFKQFNDQYGHDVGDEVLKLVARHLREQIKGRDTAARFGGEEFALILPETRLHDGGKLADRIRAGLAGHSLTSRTTHRRYGRITLSAGVAEYRYGEPLDQLVRRVDDALYAAKHRGRNCVVAEDGSVAGA